MRWEIAWTAADAAPAREAVLQGQGLPRHGTPGRIERLLDVALERFVDLARPRAVFEVVPAEAFAAVYRGEGRNPHESPLEVICPRADRLALFAVTIGETVTAAIGELFDRHEPADAWMLDAVASEATDALADALGPELLARLRQAGRAPVGDAVLPYSPGYCGWDITGQRALFARLRPDTIGITLNPSCLMQPLKSVSGVLVVGPADVHRFHPTYPFCEHCATKACRERMASPGRGEGGLIDRGNLGNR